MDEYGFFWLEIFFIAWLKVALISAISIWIIDYSTSNYLNLSSAKREAYEKLANEEDLENAVNNNGGSTHVCSYVEI